MPTVFSHPAIPLAVRVATGGAVTSRRLLATAAIGSVVPDLDAIGFLAGVPYGSLWGHRGLTHSLAFAVVLALLALPFASRLGATRGWTFALVFLATASHGVLDALTDAGLGVAFFAPFSDRRYFFPWRPLATSPIGLTEVFSPSEWHVFGWELAIVWVPSLLVALVARSVSRAWRGRATGDG